jgi:hypothetical protein
MSAEFLICFALFGFLGDSFIKVLNCGQASSVGVLEVGSPPDLEDPFEAISYGMTKPQQWVGGDTRETNEADSLRCRPVASSTVSATGNPLLICVVNNHGYFRTVKLEMRRVLKTEFAMTDNDVGM